MKKLRISFTLLIFSLVIAVVSVGFMLKTAPAANAYNCNVGPIIDDNMREFCGYFTNKFDDGVNPAGKPVLNGGVPANINTTAKFIAFILAARGGGGQNQTGAEFIIDTMLDLPGSGKAGDATRADATSLFADWQRRVQAAGNENRIVWNYAAPFRCGIENTYFQAGGANDDAFFYDGDDGCGPNVTVPSIAFKDRSGKIVYLIKRSCGNPIGRLSAIPTGNFDVTLNANQNGSPANVIPGQSYSLGVQLHNNGPAASDPANMQVDYPGAAITLPCAVACAPAGVSALTAGRSSSQGFHGSNAIGGATAPDWFWTVNSLPNNATTVGTVAFTVSPGAAPGSTITFDVYFAPGDQGGAVRHATVSFKVVSERTPSIAGINSDIHAGGGLCGQPVSNGNVTTSPKAASYGSYVISASGTINNLSSNNAVPGNNSLKAGTNGAYAQVCRQDLLSAVNRDYPLPTGISYIGGAIPTSTTLVLTGNEEGVYYYNGSHLILSGTVASVLTTKPLTIIARFGDVTINGNITLTGAPHLPNEVPSLGIISAGDILINPNVTQVDAYLFSSAGTIATCNAVPANCDTPLLTINGFLMASHILFGRTGAFNTNGNAVAENIVLNPQIYLDPPRYFDASVDDVLLQGQGERPPLF